jgi:UPF0755 protein
MKKNTGLLLIFVVLGVFVAVFAVSFWWQNIIKPVSASDEKISFVIPRGDTAMEIADKLKSKGLIRSPLAFKILIQTTGRSAEIQAGEYDLSPNMNLNQILVELGKGPVEVWVTIPEGFRREQIAQRFAKSFGLSGEAQQLYLSEFETASQSLEGQLFPDTYLFPKTVTAAKVVQTLNTTYLNKIKGLEVNNATLTMASLIERETKTDEERVIVSGILWKRFEAGWPLQVDATLQYIVAGDDCDVTDLECEWWPKLPNKDVAGSSPFNTYKNKGLPPSPIASPGLSSIQAAANPTESEHWYYLHDPKGGIHYAKTLEEHNQNINEFL